MEITLSLTEELLKRIELIVDKTKRTRSSVINELIELGLGCWGDGTAKEAVSIQELPSEVIDMINARVDAQVKKVLGIMDDQQKDALFDYLKKKSEQ